MKVICTHKEATESTRPQDIDATNKIQVGDILTVFTNDIFYEFYEYPNIPWYKKYFSLLPEKQEEELAKEREGELCF